MDITPRPMWVRTFLLLSVLALLHGCNDGSSEQPAQEGEPLAEEETPLATSDATRLDPSFSTTHFTGALNCALCHDEVPAEGANLDFVIDWSGTIMAHAAHDPLWQAKVASEVARSPAMAPAIEAKCASCHTPMAHTENVFEARDTRLLASSGGVLSADHPLHNVAMQGVSCTVCHQFQDEDLGDPASQSGGYTIADRRGTDRLLFGPLESPLTRPMQRRIGFTPVHGPHMQGSALCATCHNLKTTVLDPATGRPVEPTREFPEQQVYTEWEYSAFGEGGPEEQSCQQCHMPTRAGDNPVTNRPPAAGTHPEVSRHAFVGGNTYMLALLRANREELGLTASEDALTNALRRTEVQLVEDTAALSIGSIEQTDGLVFEVTVANLTGHKLPTSFPSHRLWLHVRVLDETGNPLWESGAPRADGRITGADGDDNPSSGEYEPHRDRISEGDQVAIWETVMETYRGNVTQTLMHAAGYAKDNRIPPRGMGPSSPGDWSHLPAEIRPAGDAVTDADFGNGTDTVTYDLPALEGRPSRIEATLHYQSVSAPFRADLLEGTGSNRPEVLHFEELDADSQRRFEPIATTSRALQ